LWPEFGKKLPFGAILRQEIFSESIFVNPPPKKKLWRINAHFHPNFGRLGVRRKAEKIWQKFAQYELDVVIVTEHAFKNPRRACELLALYRPPEARTRLIWGVEALTKEGIDVIVFAAGAELFSHAAIVHPYELSLLELLELVAGDEQLCAIIPHPYAPSKSAVSHHFSAAEMQLLSSRCGAVEKHNATFVAMQTLFERFSVLGKKGRKIRPQLREHFANTTEAPVACYAAGTTLFAGGDEHHAGDIGSYLEIAAPELPQDEHELVRFLANFRGAGRFVAKDYTLFGAALSTGRQSLTVIREGVQRRLIKNLLRSARAKRFIFSRQEKRALKSSRWHRSRRYRSPRAQIFAKWRSTTGRVRELLAARAARPKSSGVHKVP